MTRFNRTYTFINGEVITFDIDIDIEAIAKTLAMQAVRNKTCASRMMQGAAVCTIRSRSGGNDSEGIGRTAAACVAPYPKS